MLHIFEHTLLQTLGCPHRHDNVATSDCLDDSIIRDMNIYSVKYLVAPHEFLGARHVLHHPDSISQMSLDFTEFTLPIEKR